MRAWPEQDEAFVHRVEERMGKDAALRVRRLQRALEKFADALEDRDRDNIAWRMLDQLREEHRLTRNVVYEARRLLKQKPVPLDELWRLVEEELSTKVPSAAADPVPLRPVGSEAPR